MNNASKKAKGTSIGQDFGTNLIYPCEIEIHGLNEIKLIILNQNETVIEGATRVGLDLPFSCLSGSCGVCIASVTSGMVTQKEQGVLTDDQLNESMCLPCQAKPLTGKVSIKY